MNGNVETKRKATLVFLRYERAEVSTVGILSLSTALATDAEVKQALVSATTQWVNTTEEGRSLWNYSCSDLNIGDLAGSSAFQDSALLEAMAAQGLEYVDCFVSDSDGAMSYDEVLVDETAVTVEPADQQGA